MKLVNITNYRAYNSAVGTVSPGKKTMDTYHKLEHALTEVVKMCGNKFAIDLNEKEISLVERLMELDKKGHEFNPASIPDNLRKDPMGVLKAKDEVRKAQSDEIDAMKKANMQSSMRESVINGETDERKPVGLATMEGVQVDSSMLKSGFEKIMEENARIASGEKPEKSHDPSEMLDPIGAHMKKNSNGAPGAQGAQGAANESAEGVHKPGSTTPPVKEARNVPGDVTRTADTVPPTAVPTAGERAGAMDRQAAETARQLSTFGPAIEPLGGQEDPDAPDAPDAPAAPESSEAHEANEVNEANETQGDNEQPSKEDPPENWEQTSPEKEPPAKKGAKKTRGKKNSVKKGA